MYFKKSTGLEHPYSQPDEHRAKPKSGLASPKPNLKELVVEKLVRFSCTCKVNPDEVRKFFISVLYGEPKRQSFFFFSFFPAFFFFFGKRVIYYRQENKDKKVL